MKITVNQIKKIIIEELGAEDVKQKNAAAALLAKKLIQSKPVQLAINKLRESNNEYAKAYFMAFLSQAIGFDPIQDYNKIKQAHIALQKLNSQEAGAQPEAGEVDNNEPQF